MSRATSSRKQFHGLGKTNATAEQLREFMKKSRFRSKAGLHDDYLSENLSLWAIPKHKMNDFYVRP